MLITSTINIDQKTLVSLRIKLIESFLAYSKMLIKHTLQFLKVNVQHTKNIKIRAHNIERNQTFLQKGAVSWEIDTYKLCI